MSKTLYVFAFLIALAVLFVPSRMDCMTPPQERAAVIIPLDLYLPCPQCGRLRRYLRLNLHDPTTGQTITLVEKWGWCVHCDAHARIILDNPLPETAEVSDLVAYTGWALTY